ncbi:MULTISPECIES: hypothetical protein [Burkholderia]|uniref:hypothetical protein n=1 Tax=Burkholderia TaxID=32008 RepID=UPI0015827536|nr:MULTISPECIES: hypothetical protein [Burkholderia]MBN3784255.1 hypothetical protein [Burkholderia sp. Ac-20345]
MDDPWPAIDAASPDCTSSVFSPGGWPKRRRYSRLNRDAPPLRLLLSQLAPDVAFKPFDALREC